MAPSGLTWRTWLGVAANELPIALWALRPSSGAWLGVRNRADRLRAGPGVPGLRCDWLWTSSLLVNRAFPAIGRALLRRALKEWPIELRPEPAADGKPDITFVIGHRGREREPHLRLVLASIAAQREAAVECVVVEQSHRPELEGRLPRWVRYEHTPVPGPDTPYNRSWALNVGARLARGDLLVLHDNDMLVPRDYAREMLRQASVGYHVLNLKRLVFYLGQDDSAGVLGVGRLTLAERPAEITQNLEAGGSVAVTAATFEALGGFDEAFVGWGGEDNEFWERAQTRRVYPWGYLPLVHLWHSPQPGKGSGLDAPAVARYYALRDRPVEERIAGLRGRPAGRREGPWSPQEPGTV